MTQPTAYTMRGSTADGQIFSPEMNSYLERGYISVLFYTDGTLATQVTPTAGTITFEGTESQTGYGSFDKGTIDLSVATYDRPNFAGAVRRVRATCAGIVGAGYFVATISRFGGV